MTTRDPITQIAEMVALWNAETGQNCNPLMRIALAGYEGEHQMPADWDCWAWNAGEGFGGQKLDGKTGNGRRERIWFSPGCVRSNQPNLL